MAKKSDTKIEKAENVVPQDKLAGIKSGLKKAIWVAVLAGAIWVLWKNPQIIAKTRMMFDNWTEKTAVAEEVTQEQDEISALRQEIAYLREATANISSGTNLAEVERLNDKFAVLEKTNLNIIDSKADASAVLGIVNRLDKLEDQVEKLARTTDESALILTAAMLVKDAAGQGGSFEYEAQVLQQLAENNQNIKGAVATISKYALAGVKTNAFLINDFKMVYKNLLDKQKEEFEKTWKDRVNSKLSEIIKVRRSDEKAPEFEEDQALDQVKRLVEAEDFVPAMAILSQQENAKLMEDAGLANWVQMARAKQEFNSAVNQITNNALAVMKVNSLKQETAYD